MTDDSNFSTRRRLASKINESTDVLWSDDSLGEVVDAVLAEFVVIPRSELPEVTLSERPTTGYYTALAQQRYQPRLILAVEDGDKTDGTWNRNIAYANLAVAEAVERHDSVSEVKRNARRDELCREFTNDGHAYAHAAPSTQHAINRIIELEEAAS